MGFFDDLFSDDDDDKKEKKHKKKESIKKMTLTMTRVSFPVSLMMTMMKK